MTGPFVSAPADLSAFWGKAGDGATAHPVICHMIDVGNVVRAFLQRASGAGLRRRLARDLNVAEATLVRLFAFLAAAHDIGKVSAGFQRKREDLWCALVALGYTAGPNAQPDHGHVTQVALKRFLKDRIGNVELALALSRMVAAHHGAFPQVGRATEREFAAGAWVEAQDRHIQELERIFEPDWAPLRALGDEPLAAGCLMSLAGVTSLCDWIGSSTDHFPFQPLGARATDAYADESRLRAERALEVIGLTGWTPSRTELDFAGAFGFAPNALQDTVIDWTQRADGQAMLVVEAPMGLGKTEAALAAADALLRRQTLGGIYYALPTQATSNQMFGRLVRFLERRCPGAKVDVHLLHGLSDLNETYRELRLAAIGQNPEATVRASTWFTARKRGLIAPFGVGTIDQALLAGMAVRHMFVRLAGLADKVVVLDEVHAYDAYMSKLLDHLVGWLAALGSSVVVLSATLPTNRRDELAAAFGGSSKPTARGYPQVTAVSPGRVPETVVVGAPASYSIALHRVAACDGAPDAIGATILERLKGGGCAAWICNTVDGAQRAYEAIRRQVPCDCEQFLFHARFPTGIRQEIEARVLRAFGKQGDRPRRAVLVATQVVEQSLDVDFDLMVTDLAPVDLMLQRAGRLHRHRDRQRPDGLKRPVLLWMEPPLQDGLPMFGVHEHVYERFVLLRTWLAIRERTEASIPSDVPRLVEEVYGSGATADERARTALADARDDLERRRARDLAKAQAVQFVTPDGIDLLYTMQVALDDDETSAIHHALKARTRLTRPSVTVVCGQRRGKAIELLDGSLLDLGKPPERDEVRSIRLSSVAIQRWEWWKHFASKPVPDAWQHIAALRDSRVAEFQDGVLEVSGLRTRLELSADLGLVIRSFSEESA
jgi:CRISPR-associated endonuclease/helicase Cas3